MAKLVDILQVEKDRQEEATWAVVHLFKTGSFYSAYEWSAWLIAVITFNDEVRMRTKDRKTFARIERNIVNLDLRNEQHVRSTVNSYLGVLSHSASYNLRRDVFGSDTLAKVIEIDDNFLKCA